MGWKIIAAIILIIIGFNLVAFAYMKRRIAAAKAEGYRRIAAEQTQAREQGQGGGSTDAGPLTPAYTHKTDLWARDTHGNHHSSSDHGNGDTGWSGDSGGDSGGGDGGGD